MGRTKYLRYVFFCLLLATILSGCSGDQEKKEAGTIEKMTDKAAEQAVQNIRQPIERAEQVQAIQEAHTRAINEAIENSSGR
jgi:PBP1b-binding outer membrane lipoprotein LpoB